MRSQGSHKRKIGTILLLPPAYLLLLGAKPVLSIGAKVLRGGIPGIFHPAIFYGLAALSFFFAILTHELAQAWAMRRAGWQVATIAVFPFVHDFRTGKITWWASLDGDIGGHVLARPPDARSRRADAVVFSAGTLANFICVLIFVPIAAVQDIAVIDALAGGIAATSLVVGLGNLVPFRTPGGYVSNGGRLLALGLSGLGATFARGQRGA
jgi:Zn-dependent protease